MSNFEGLDQNKHSEKPTFLRKIGKLWLKYGDKIILTIGIIAIAAISFEAGFLHGQKNQKEPIVVNQATGVPCPETETAGNLDQNAISQENPTAKKEATSAPGETKNCPYVASKNSNKYHLSSCQFAQKIKTENKVCFSSADEAVKRGYQSAKCCIK